MTVYELIQEVTAKYHPNDTVYICDGGDEVKVESVNDYGGEPILHSSAQAIQAQV